MLNSTSFIFNGQSSDQYGLMIYFLEDEDKRELELGTSSEIIEDRPTRRITPISYGVSINKGMEFELVFGSREYLDDYDVDAILGWLTGYNDYKYLEYVDGGHYVRYKCIIRDVKTVYINGFPVAFKATITCDSQFSREYPKTMSYSVNGSSEADVINSGSYNGYYYPESLVIKFGNDCDGVQIINHTDGDRTFEISGIEKYILDSDSLGQSMTTPIKDLISSDTKATLGWSLAALTCNDEDGNGLTSGYSSMAFGGGKYVATAYNSNLVCYSNEGKTWYHSTLPFSGVWHLCYGNGKFVAVMENSNKTCYSVDGKSWAAGGELPVVTRWLDICVGTDNVLNDVFVAVGQDASCIAYSTNGLIWRQYQVAATLPDHTAWQSIAYGGGRFVAVGTGSGGLNVAITSENGQTWTTTKMPSAQKWKGITYGDFGFVAVADTSSKVDDSGNVCAYSKDGLTWTAHDLIRTNWTDVVYGEYGYIAVANNSQLYAVSVDGKTWNTSLMSETCSWCDLFYNDKTYYCLATDSINYLSSTANDYVTGSFEYTDLTYSFAELAALTEEQIQDIATARGYTLEGTDQTDLIRSFLIEQEDQVVTSMNIKATLTNTLDSTTYESTGMQTASVKTASLSKDELSGAVDEEVDTGTIYTRAQVAVLDYTDLVNLCAQEGYKVDETLTTQELVESFLAQQTAAHPSDSGSTSKTTTSNNMVLANAKAANVLGEACFTITPSYNEANKTLWFNYVINKSIVDMMGASLVINLSYRQSRKVELGYAGVTVTVDNENQIITADKDGFNGYEYFNNKFFRLVKGVNNVEIKAHSFNDSDDTTYTGSCTVNLTCEFLRK